MNLRPLIRIVTLSGAILCSTAVIADSLGWKLQENNNLLIEAQRQGGDHTAVAPVKVTYLGHMAFLITSPKGLKVVIDPWRNDPSGAWGLWFPQAFPPVVADVVLSTHAHFDHDAISRTRGVTVHERLTGELIVGDVKITGLADKHVCRAKGWYEWSKSAAEFGQNFCPPENFLHMDNFIQVIETGGLKIVHWGDNRPQPAQHVEAALADVDVLILPVDDSSHLLDTEDIAAAIDRYAPSVVIPSHYRMPGISSVLTTLGTAEKWVAAQPAVTKLDGPEIMLERDAIKELNAQVLYFGNHHATGLK